MCTTIGNYLYWECDAWLFIDFWNVVIYRPTIEIVCPVSSERSVILLQPVLTTEKRRVRRVSCNAHKSNCRIHFSMIISFSIIITFFLISYSHTQKGETLFIIRSRRTQNIITIKNATTTQAAMCHVSHMDIYRISFFLFIIALFI